MIDTLLKLLYPPKCMFCRQLVSENEKQYICEACYHTLHAEIAERLKLAGQDIETILERAEEKMQEEEMPDVLGVFPLFPYTGIYRKTVIRWKYAGIRRYAKGFAKLIIEDTKLFEKIKIDTLVPVPLAPSRMRKRGFNQASDLAEAISEQTGIAVQNCLRRIRDTKPQAKCNIQERQKNVRESMKCYINEKMQKIDIKNVLIIDDIYTTGSTIKECCRALKIEEHLSDIRIYVLVICKGEI